MTTSTGAPKPMTTTGALARAALAAAVMGISLGLAGWFGSLVGATAGPDQPLHVRVLVAGSVCVAVVVVIVVLRRRGDRRSLGSMGLTGPRASARGFGLGIGVVLASAAVVAAVMTLLGGLRWTGFDAPALLGFLLTNTIVALLLEAVPEEIAIRGYALSALQERFGAFLAGLLGILTFLLVPVIAVGVPWMLERLTAPAGPVTPDAGGQDVGTYLLTLAAFGLLLTYARGATLAATVWTCIGAHLAWLTVNRIVLGSTEGLTVELSPDAELLFFAVYTAVAVIAFSLAASRVARLRKAAAAPNQEEHSTSGDL